MSGGSAETDAFGRTVRAHRRRIGLTQEELAERIGVSTSTIGKLEAGRVTTPRQATVRLLADAFGLHGDARDRFHRAATGERAASGEPAAAPGAGRVAQLPPDIFPFTGRQEALARLDELLAGAHEQPTAVMIAAVSGSAGVGKTALAVHWAHRVADRFPDGQLYIDLRGYHPGPPVHPAEALARLLGVLGVADRDIPTEVDDQAARYRTQLAGRRVVILLDNAADVEQVRPLLPGSPSCAVIVTSRDDLAGLVAVHGARRLTLDPLPAADARTLLRHLIGPRVDSEPDAAATLADRCARLPLAVRIAAELAAARPALPLTDLVREFADHRQRLELLDAGDPRADVRAVFSWSFRHLPPEAARVFRLVGLHPGADVDTHAAAALAATSPAQSRRALDLLVRAHLLHPTGHRRYGMHDLLRAYAISLAAEEDPGADRHAAVGRLLDHYLATAAAAMDRLYPAEAHTRPRVAGPTTAMLELADRAAARDWLDAERANLVAAVVHAAADGRPAHAYGLSRTLLRYLRGGHHADAVAIYDSVLRLARRLGDTAEEAHALVGLGGAWLRTARYGAATESLQRARALFQQVGDPLGEATALYSLAVVEHRGLSRHREAAGLLERARELYRQAGDPTGEASVLNNLGIIERRLGRLDLAADYQEQAVTLAQKIGDEGTEAYALNSLGLVEGRLRRYDAAVGHLTRALRLFREAGDRGGEASALDNLGTAYVGLGRHDEAGECFTRALAILREVRDRDGEAWALNSIGEAVLATGRPDEARTQHAEALTVATEIGARDQQARAHAGLGAAYRQLRLPERAREHLAEALRRYVELESPKAADVRAALTELAGLAGLDG